MKYERKETVELHFIMSLEEAVSLKTTLCSLLINCPTTDDEVKAVKVLNQTIENLRYLIDF